MLFKIDVWCGNEKVAFHIIYQLWSRYEMMIDGLEVRHQTLGAEN